jgi:transposase InsO family protein
VERWREAGCSVLTACRLVGVSRSGSDVARQARPAPAPTPDPTEAALRARIRSITEAHFFWGYRQVWAWLRDREGIRVNKQRGSRLMKAAGLTVKPGRHGATRTPQPKPTATRPRQSWGIDMTKFLIPTLGWADVVIVLDWDPKKIVGWNLSLRSRRQEWEAALAMGVPAEFPQGGRGAGVKLGSDHGSQPTASGFMAALSPVGIEPVVTRDDHPQGKAEPDRLRRTIKDKRRWLQEVRPLEAARAAIAQWITVDDTQRDAHAALEDRSPVEFEAALREQEAAHAAAEDDSRSAPDNVS